MRIVRLDLLAYGPFTRQRLELGPGLHLIYGPNEAGKSTTLMAIRHLLFGFDHAITHAFLHPAESLRLGGVLEGRAGRLEFIRRRGRTKTLRATDDTTLLDDSALHPFLPCEDATQFEAAFGLTHDRLVEGGKAMLSSNGEYGEQLFAASRGILGLRTVQQALEESAEALFVPRGSSRRINTAISQWEKAIKRRNGSITTAAEYRRTRDARDEAERAALDMQQQQHESQSRLQQLRRLERAIPLLAQRRAAVDACAPFRQARLLPSDFAGRYQQILARESQAQALVASLGQALHRIDRDYDTLPVVEALITHQARIEYLYKELGSRQKADSDRARRGAELQSLEQEVRALRREMGLADEAPLPRLTAEQRSRIHELADSRQAIVQSEQEAQRTLQASRTGALETERELRSLLESPAVGDLRRIAQRIERDGALEETLRRHDRNEREVRAQLDRELIGLSPWTGTLEDLERAPAPSAETIQRSMEEWRAGEMASDRMRERRQEESRRVQKTEALLRTLERGGAVPTEAELSIIRTHRQELWQQVRVAWGDGDQTIEPLASRFEHAIDAADGTADHLRRDAKRVAEKAALSDELAHGQTRLAALEAERHLLNERQRAAQEQWEQLWRPCGVTPLSPYEMAGWLQRRQRLLERAQDLREAAQRGEELRAKIAVHRADLGRELERAGRVGAAPDEGLTALLDRTALVLEQARILDEQRSKLKSDLAFIENEVPGFERRLAAARRARHTWHEDWSTAIQMIPVSPQASPDQVRQVLDWIERAQQKCQQIESLRARIAAMGRDAAQFEQAVADIVRSTAPDLADRPAETSVAELWQRLKTALSNRDQRAGLAKQRAATQNQMEQAELVLLESRHAIASLAREAGGVAVEDLSACIEMSGHRREAEQHLREIDQQLAVCAGSLTLEQLAAEAEGIAIDDLPARLAQEQQRVDELAQKEIQMRQLCWERQTELDRLQGDSDATQAAEEAESWRVRIETDVEEFVRLRLAAAVLKGAMERYGQANQGPLLARASELFRLLTCGSFDELRLEWDEHGRATLVGVRPTGLVDASGMSEGACDQLYLALRLASLERHCAEQEPTPFVADDILVNFDDTRAAAALRALEQLARRTQVLLFTHHQHLVGLAQRTLGDSNLLFIHQLGEMAVGVGE